MSVQYSSHAWSKTLIQQTLFFQREIALHTPSVYLRDRAYPDWAYAGKIYDCFSQDAIYGEETA
jgi:hypothetical protein